MSGSKADERVAPARKKASRPRDPQATMRSILIAARDEFVEHGLTGARVDRIAERACTNKRMLYHYFGNKEALYSRVLLEAYRDIREGEAKLQLAQFDPTDAMVRLVGFTFDHFRDNPWFIRLLSTENIHRAQFVSQIREMRDLQSPIIDQIRTVLERGEKTGEFRTGVDPLELYITIAGLSYFFFSNVHTLSVAFSAPLYTEEKMAERRAHAVDVVLSYLHDTTGLPANN